MNYLAIFCSLFLAVSQSAMSASSSTSELVKPESASSPLSSFSLSSSSGSSSALDNNNNWHTDQLGNKAVLVTVKSLNKLFAATGGNRELSDTELLHTSSVQVEEAVGHIKSLNYKNKQLTDRIETQKAEIDALKEQLSKIKGAS